MSKDFTNPSIKQLFELMPSTLEPSTLNNVERFIEQDGSVFELLKLGRQGVVETFGLHSRDAQVLLDRATGLAVHTARKFREQRLVTQTPPNPLHRTGITTICSVPTGRASALRKARIPASRQRRILCGW
jgi:hypothetical protein